MNVRKDLTDIGEKKYIPSQRYYNDTTMIFFREILLFFAKCRSVCQKTENKNINLKFGSREFYVDMQMERKTEHLLWFFKMFYNECFMKKMEISSKRDYDGEIITLYYYKNRDVQYFEIDDIVGIDRIRIDKIIKTLDSTFVDDIVRKKLKRLYEKLKISFDSFSGNNIFNRVHIFQILNVYYEILSCILCENGLLETEGVIENILIPTLNLGIYENNEDRQCKATFDMPIILVAVNRIYDKLDEFLFLEVESEEMEEPVYQEIFLAKVHQIFRFYLIREKNGELYHAALPAYKREIDHSSMSIPVRALSTYDSYQGIRELRLADKILFEFNRRYSLDKLDEKINANMVYRVVIMGDLLVDAIDEMLVYMDKEITIKDEYINIRNINLAIYAYTLRAKNECEKIERKKFTCVYQEYKRQLLDATKLKDIIKKGDLFFFLDNCDLYRDEIEEINDLITFRQYISFDNYKDYYRNCSTDMTLEGKLTDLYHALTMYAWKNKLGFYRKKAREDIVKYIRNEVETQRGKSAYIYISDLDAFKNLKCIQENIVRIESYNQKEIGIIRFTNYEREKLPIFFKPKSGNVGLRKHILVFNMWQLVKHIVLNHKNNFEYYFIRNQNKCMLNQIYIAVDYENWKNVIWISYWYKDKKVYKRENLEKFISFILRKVFIDEKKDMYQTYLQKVIISILYGAAKSVEDLLFVHILEKKKELIGKFVWRGETLKSGKKIREDEGKYNPIIEEYYDLNCKYAMKGNYWETMKRFDKYCLNILEQYSVLETIKKSSRVQMNMDRKTSISQVLEAILDACREMGYEKSLLYNQCKKMIEKNI